MSLHSRIACAALLVGATGCISVVRSNERALFVSASEGVSTTPVTAGTYWHWPWNKYIKYDLRWRQHTEKIDIQTRDGLHLTLDITTVVRPRPDALAAVDATVGPQFYDHVVRPALFASVRAVGGDVIQRQLVRHTHEVEAAIKDALVVRLRDKPIDVSEVAVQHFDLPDELKTAANRTAASEQLIAAKDVELAVTQRDAAIQVEKRKGAVELEGMERRLRGEQEVLAAEQAWKLEEVRRRVEREKAATAAELVTIKAEADARATVIAAEAEKKRIQAASTAMSDNYVRLRSLELLAQTMSSGNEKLIVVPTGANGLPAFFAPFLNPFVPPAAR